MNSREPCKGCGELTHQRANGKPYCSADCMPGDEKEKTEVTLRRVLGMYYDGLKELIAIGDKALTTIAAFAAMALIISGPVAPLLLVHQHVQEIPSWLPPAALIGWWVFILAPLILGWEPSREVA